METSDEHVLRTLMRHRRLTRAELATEIGISRPTAGESVRRLAARGLVADTGERTPGGRGRGRVGSYYALSPTIGVALAVTIAPEGVVAECVDVYGDVVGRAARPADPSKVATAISAAAQQARGEDGPPIRLAVVGAADPVDRATGRLVHLPDAPFLVGELDPVAILGRFVDGPIIVDNDVNWAALAERDRHGAGDFAYLYLGEGLGCAIVSDGEVRRGHTGLAGEIAHMLTVGPDGRAIRFIELFGELDLRRERSDGTGARGDKTAIDVDRLLTSDATTRAALGSAVGGVVAAVIALADPREVVIGGPWGPALVAEIRAATERMPRHVPVRAAALDDEPVLAGVRAEAIDRLRALVAAGE
ncbi:ROK family transcriptional regulator [Actinoplanes sp. NPDC048988]|uniref:ROK family transcriptional regulator n=1 Tax=Actinoplanes sp. NPDC048988 TaxID=3363901 RepID=UPI00371B1A48